LPRSKLSTTVTPDDPQVMKSKSPKDKPNPPEARPQTHVGVDPKIWILTLLLVCLAQFILLAVLFLSKPSPGTPPTSPATAPTAPRLAPYSPTQRDPYFAGRPGPWGELEYARFDLEPTDEFVAEELKTLTQTRWFFEHMERDRVQDLIQGLGLPPSLEAECLNASEWKQEPTGVLLAPTGHLVMSLPPEIRARLYSFLANCPRNDLQAWPFIYRNGGFEDWFQRSGLSATTIGLVKQVLYQRGPALCVSDAPELLARIPDLDERLRLIKTLSRASALIMKLRIRPDTDTKALAAYWGRGWHVNDIEPLLSSLTKLPTGITIDVAHLLPPFARKRLSSFPAPLMPSQRPPDCYWTAWNFFRDPPDDRYFDDGFWRSELQQDWQVVDQASFGDLLFLTRPDGVPVHSAVFIADDVVFTKNGSNLRQPWKLMKIEDMLARYPADIPLKVSVFRRKS